MSLDAREMGRFVAVAIDAVRLIDATTIAITDLVQTNITRNQLATLINRYYAETPNVGTLPTIAQT